MNIQSYWLAVGFVFAGACFSKAVKKDSVTIQVPDTNQTIQPSVASGSCARPSDCDDTEHCFEGVCITAALDMNCTLPEYESNSPKKDEEKSGAECIFTVDADGDSTEEVLRISRDFDRNMIDIDIMDARTLQTRHFEITTDNIISLSPVVSLAVIPKEFAGKPLLKVDVPGAEACDSASNVYYLSYSSIRGVQIATSTGSASGEMGSFESSVEFFPDGSAQHITVQEQFGGDTGLPDGPDRVERRMCIKDGIYVACPDGETYITVNEERP